MTVPNEHDRGSAPQAPPGAAGRGRRRRRAAGRAGRRREPRPGEPGPLYACARRAGERAQAGVAGRRAGAQVRGRARRQRPDRRQGQPRAGPGERRLAADALREGTQATLRLLDKAFEKAGVTEIDPQGEPFNPELPRGDGHAAAPPSTCRTRSLQVVQKGYQLNGRLLRPARGDRVAKPST